MTSGGGRPVRLKIPPGIFIQKILPGILSISSLLYFFQERYFFFIKSKHTQHNISVTIAAEL